MAESHAARPVPTFTDPAVLLDRDGSTLRITINRPQRHNAFSREVRDGLDDALDLVGLDASITDVRLSGIGASFCSGGDLDEFGTTPDVATAHLIRMDRSVAARVHRCRERVHVELHGACIGAGIEIPSFAADVGARDDTYFQLPELAMGLVPGAGGTVGITRRIGRWRAAYLALTGARVGVGTALEWGLIDRRVLGAGGSIPERWR
jgi:enoyl-CoA hydratase/carnithine racemase